jgi:hypothetical protein
MMKVRNDSRRDLGAHLRPRYVLTPFGAPEPLTVSDGLTTLERFIALGDDAELGEKPPVRVRGVTAATYAPTVRVRAQLITGRRLFADASSAAMKTRLDPIVTVRAAPRATRLMYFAALGFCCSRLREPRRRVLRSA